jgi:hypothetical protein
MFKHFPSMLICFCIFYFHWIVWFFLMWQLDTPSFFNKVTNSDFLIVIFQSIALLSSHLLAWLVVFSLCFLPSCYVFHGHTSNELWNFDYNKIPLQKVQFLSIAFDGDFLFNLPPMLLTIHTPLQMQGMDRKYDDHVWCKVITTNIKNKFGF